MKTKRISLYGICRTALLILSVLTLLFLLTLNFFYLAEVSYNASEKVTILTHTLPSLVMLLLAAAVTVLLGLLAPLTDRLREHWVFLFFSAAYVLMAIYLLLNVDLGIRADAWLTFDSALDIKNGDFATLEPGGYIHRYPNQIGLMFYDSILLRFAENTAVFFLANLAFVLGINLLMRAIAATLFSSHRVNLIAILLSFLFFPQFFFILFAYGLIPGFFFMMLAFYHAVRFSKRHKIRNAVGAVLGAAAAATLKQNFLIGAIAIGIFLLLEFLREKGLRRLYPLIATVCIAAVLLLPTKLITAGYEAKTGASLDEGTPALAWVVMGTDIDNSYLGPGWYSGYNYSIYTQAGYRTEEAAELAREGLERNVEKIRKDPQRAAEFFLAKTVSQWCEPMFQSVWSGPLADCYQEAHTPLLQSLYTGGEVEDHFETFAKAILLTVLAASTVGLIAARRHRGWELFVMFLIGGLLFHTVWEGKSQYIYPYIFVLIPLAAYGIAVSGGRIAGWIKAIAERRIPHGKQ